MEQQERNIQPISSQEHRDAIPPMFSREINWSEGFPNMVLSTEYSEAVNARYTFQPLWVSGTNRRHHSIGVRTWKNILLRGHKSFYMNRILKHLILNDFLSEISSH